MSPLVATGGLRWGASTGYQIIEMLRFLQTNLSDRLDLMPIISPAFPEQNSSYNVTKTNLSLIKRAIEEGWETIQEIKSLELTRTAEELGNAKQAGVAFDSHWSKLFEEDMRFFTKCKHFIVIIATSSGLCSKHRSW